MTSSFDELCRERANWLWEGYTSGMSNHGPDIDGRFTGDARPWMYRVP